MSQPKSPVAHPQAPVVRTRFAPSPTGFMHVGNLRTGLFAWLTARHAGGTFILRLEDTDKNREVEGSAEHIIRCLDLLGLNRDEGVDVGGPYAPYKQSERLAVYKAWAQKLIDAGRAYADPYSSEQVQAFREEAQKQKKPFLYRLHRPESAGRRTPAWDGKQPLRFKSEPKTYNWHDLVMGDISTGPEVIDDFILIKSDGFPTYNFAHVVDDAEMKVSHVIRGQEFISSQPNYFNLYEALGLTPPIFATMPHILNEQGNKKLGKRDGAKDVLDYIREGFLPETLLNFIATLGWNDGTEQEIFSRDELIEKFSLERVQRSGARFDEKRLEWMNGQWIRRLEIDDLMARVKDFWPENAKNTQEAFRRSVLELAQERLRTLADLPKLTSFFFERPVPKWELIASDKQLKKFNQTELKHLLETARENLKDSDFSTEDLQNRLNQLLEQTGQKPAVLFSLIRYALTWTPFSPGLAETMNLLGKDESLERLKAATA